MSEYTYYSDEVALRIAAGLAEGKSLSSICAASDMPSVKTVYQWRREKPDFDTLLRNAREDQADSLADMIFSAMKDLETAETMVAVSRARERIQALQWMASKLKPKEYGQQKQEISVTTSYVDALRQINDEERKPSKSARRVRNTRAINDLAPIVKH